MTMHALQEIGVHSSVYLNSLGPTNIIQIMFIGFEN
jgi:hypothetical protein